MLLKEKLGNENIFQKMYDKGILTDFLNGQQDILNKKLLTDYGEKQILYDNLSVDEIVDLIIFYCKDKWNNIYQLIDFTKPLPTLTNNKKYTGSTNNSSVVTNKISSYDSDVMNDNEENNKNDNNTTNYTLDTTQDNKNFLKQLQNYNNNLYFTNLSDTILLDIDNLINTSLWG